MATPELHELDPIISPSGFACYRSTWLSRLLTWYEVGYLGYCWWIEREGGSSDPETYQTIRSKCEVSDFYLPFNISKCIWAVINVT